MKELTAIIPQYRASILALQGRIAVLNKQLEKVTAEKNQLQRDAASWRDAAQRNEASFAEVAAKLHTQEAASLASMTSSQQLAARLESELASLRQQHTVAEKELKEAQCAAQQAQQAVESQQKLLNTQSNTISRLETTVREQQEDIIAALDLVCHQTPSGGGGGLVGAAPVSAHLAAGVNSDGNRENEIDIDANLDFLDTLGVSNSSKQPMNRAAAAAAIGEGKARADENWTIPAASGAGVAGANGIHSDDGDNLETWLHDSSFTTTTSKNPSPMKMKKINNKIFAENIDNKIQKINHNSVAMADLATDIAALRDALQRVL
jgi:hypothetical protein